MISTKVRRARVRHYCDVCSSGIYPGDRYLHGAMSPMHDGNGNQHWWNLTECESCSRLRGQGALYDAGEAS